MEKKNQRVVWFEGMTLDPHHFQQWDRNHRQNLKHLLTAVCSYYWGVSELSIDEDGISNGQFHLLRCSGILPDGGSFEIPASDRAPNPRNFKDHFQALADNLGVYLAIPGERSSGCNFLFQDAENPQETRYKVEEISVNDHNTGSDPREISVGLTNFQLRFDGESLEDYSALKIAEITRSADGTFKLNEQFIPPAIQIGASKTLQNLARSLLELLIAKSNSLSQRVQQTASQGALTFADLKAIGMLSTLYAYVPLCNHYYVGSRNHPEAFYRVLLALAGQLAAYTDQPPVHPRDLPVYDPEHLSKSFKALEKAVRGILGEPISTNFISIPLDKTRESVYSAQNIDQALLEGDKLYLLVSGDFPDAKITGELPVKLRIASPDKIDAVLQSMIRALNIQHIPAPPTGLPRKPGTFYFKLEQQGPFWESIHQTQAMAIFIPAEFSGLNLEVLAIQ